MCFFYWFITLLYVLAIVDLNSAESPYCKKNYLSFSRYHTACKTPKRSCHIIASGVDRKDTSRIVSNHNKLRARIAAGNESYQGFPSSANMFMLGWDSELAAIAQAHASQCTFQHDCYHCRRSNKFEVVGQNLFLLRTSWMQTKPQWDRVIKMWYDELKIAPQSLVYRFETRGLNIGHFTQIVWANTMKVGCGFVAYLIHNSVYKVAHLYSCNYGPGGNYIGSELYKIGKPASQCPKFSRPSSTYPSLCRSHLYKSFRTKTITIKKRIRNHQTKRIIHRKIIRRYYKSKTRTIRRKFYWQNITRLLKQRFT